MTTMTIFGRLTKDPEVKESNGKKYITFGIASKSMHSKATEFFNCSSFNEQIITFMEYYLKKGNPLCVTGEPRAFDGKNGVKVWNITVTNVEAMKEREEKSGDLPF